MLCPLLPADNDPQATWLLCGDILRAVAVTAKEIANLSFNFAKCNVLAPASLPDDTQELLPQGVSVVRAGLRLAGAPIGTDEFCATFFQAQVNSVKRKLAALADLSPQVGFALLRAGINPSLNFFAQVTPPHLDMQ